MSDTDKDKHMMLNTQFIKLIFVLTKPYK